MNALARFLKSPGLSPTSPPLRVMDVFAGAGGFSLGFARAGFEIAGAVEIDALAAATYSNNIEYFQGRPVRMYGGEVDGDMRTLDPERVLAEVGPCDVLIGGPPCKAFSRVGRGKLNHLHRQEQREAGFMEDARNSLYENFKHFLEVLRPAAFVMENVAGMLSMEGRNVADVAARALSEPFEEGGPSYIVRYALLNASWYGVPQHRQRIIFLGLRADLGLLPSMPARLTTGASTGSGYLPWPERRDQAELFEVDLTTIPVPSVPRPAAPVSVSDALDDLPPIHSHLSRENPHGGDWSVPDTGRATTPFARLMRTWDAPKSVQQRRRNDEITAHVIRMTQRDFETFRLMQPGDRYPEAVRLAEQRLAQARQHDPSISADEIIPPYPLDGGFEDRWQKLRPGEPSHTVTAHLSKDTYSHIHHGDQARALSVREAARLQSFPDRFMFGPRGGMNAAFSQIGNAVPPLMAFAIARHVRELLEASGRAPRTAQRTQGT